MVSRRPTNVVASIGGLASPCEMWWTTRSFFPRELQFSRLGNIPPILYSPSSLQSLLTQEPAREAGTLQLNAMLWEIRWHKERSTFLVFFFCLRWINEASTTIITHSKPYNKTKKICPSPQIAPQFQMQLCTFHCLYNLLVKTHSQLNNALRIWRERGPDRQTAVCRKRLMRLPSISSSQVGHSRFQKSILSVRSIGDKGQSQRRCNSNCGKSSLLGYDAVSIIRRRFGEDGLCLLGLNSPSSFSATLPRLLGPRERRQQDFETTTRHGVMSQN